MFTRLSVAVLAILVVALGVTTFAFSKRSQETSVELEQAQVELQKLKVKRTTAGSDDSLRDLLSQQEEANAQLREELAKLKQQPATELPSNRDAGNNQRRGGGAGGGNAWMDRLKQEDPERYKQIIQQREERRKAMDQRYKETMDQLDQRAQSAPTQVEADLVGQIADTLAKLNDLRQKWQAIRSLPEDQQQAQMPDLSAQMRQTTDQLRDLSQQDRTLQLQNYARSLGVTDDNGIQNFVNGVSGIYSNTNYRAIIGGGGFGGGGPGGPPRGAGSPPPPTQ